MSALTCDRARELLSPFFGEELDAAAGAELRAHLRACPACRTEAATFQRALGALRSFGAAGAPAPDDTLFGGMHAAIVAACSAQEPEPVAGSAWRWPLLAAAAAALVAVGFWWGHEPEVSVWDRPPLDATDAVFSGDTPKAVPWSGPRVPLRLLGDDDHDGGEADREGREVGSGLRARDRLRSLVDDGMLLPPRRTAPAPARDGVPGRQGVPSRQGGR